MFVGKMNLISLPGSVEQAYVFQTWRLTNYLRVNWMKILPAIISLPKFSDGLFVTTYELQDMYVNSLFYKKSYEIYEKKILQWTEKKLGKNHNATI